MKRAMEITVVDQDGQPFEVEYKWDNVTETLKIVVDLTNALEVEYQHGYDSGYFDGQEGY